VRPSANAPVMPWRPSAPGQSDWAQRRPYRMQITHRTIAERGNGRTFQVIAEGLMADGVPTARGKTRWYAATIKAVVTSDNAAALA
jgi:hypothetical protein